jgi:hypothetical protein
MPRPRLPHAERDRLNVTITVDRETLARIEEEAARDGSKLSVYFLRATEMYLDAPQVGGRRILPSRDFAVLMVRPDEHCFVPRHWTPDDLRRAAEVLEAQGLDTKR